MGKNKKRYISVTGKLLGELKNQIEKAKESQSIC